MLDIRQKFEGVIQSITDSEIKAYLKDLTNINNPEEMILILKEKFPELHLYQIGSMFNWELGYETLNGTTRRYSKITKIDLGVWTQEDIDNAEHQANIYSEFFNREN